jgi:voltage-gated potassium channel Kch
LSIVAFILETVSDLEVMSDAFSVIEVAVTAVFTAEIVARLMSCPSPRAYCTILNIVDVIAVLPLYLEAAVQGDARATDSLKIMRILRLFRIFKLSRYFSAIKLIVGALTLSAVPLMMALFLTLLGTVLFASAMYYIERGAWDAQREIYIHQASGAPSDFQSILDAMWWTTIALATVGYGDVGPRTGEGKALGVVVALSGVVILAFPISIFAANFSELYVLTQRRAALQKELSSDLLAGLSRIAADRDDVQADGIPRFNNPHLPTPTPSSKGSGVFFSAGAADDAPGEPWRQQPQGKEHFEAAAAAQAAPRGLETMRRLQKIASTHFVTLADTEVDANTAAEVFGLHPASAQPAMPRVGKARQRSASDAKQAGQLMTPYGWSHSVVSNSHEAQSLVEAVAIARAARRYQVMEVGEEDSRMVRGSSFAHLNLTDDEILRASVSKLCRDARKRIWLKIRRREQKMHDAVAIELARRWRSWFDVDAETVIGVTEVMVDDKALLRKEASVLSLAELEPGSVGPSPSANSADEHVESSQRDREKPFPDSEKATTAPAAPPLPPVQPTSRSTQCAGTGPPSASSLQPQAPGARGGAGARQGAVEAEGPAPRKAETEHETEAEAPSRQVRGAVLPEEEDADDDPTAPEHEGEEPSAVNTSRAFSARQILNRATDSLTSLAKEESRTKPRTASESDLDDHRSLPSLQPRASRHRQSRSKHASPQRRPAPTRPAHRDLLPPVAPPSKPRVRHRLATGGLMRAAGNNDSQQSDASHRADDTVSDEEHDDDDDDDDVVYRKRTVTRLVRKDQQGGNVEETTEVLEEHRRRRRRRKRPQ